MALAGKIWKNEGKRRWKKEKNPPISESFKVSPQLLAFSALGYRQKCSPQTGFEFADFLFFLGEFPFWQLCLLVSSLVAD